MTGLLGPHDASFRSRAAARDALCRWRPHLLALLASSSLVACGGGSDSSPPDGGGGDGGGAGEDATLPSERRCSSDGICWYSPTPQGEALDHVWASGPDDAWAVGESGVVLHWDGERSRHSPTGSDAPLYGLWGSGPEDVWAVGEQVVLRWNGDAWAEVDDIPVGGVTWRAVTGSGRDDVWLVGDDTALHYDGVEWTEREWPRPAGGAVMDTWVAAPDDIWILYEDGAVHWDGGSLTEQTLPTARSGALRTLAAAGPDDIWALGEDGAASHFDGTEWSGENLGTRDIAAAWAFADGRIWGASRGSVYRLEDEGWQARTHLSGNPGLTENIADLAGVPDETLFAVGAGGLFGMWTGEEWATTGGREAFADVISGVAPDDFWTGGLSGLARWRPSGIDHHTSHLGHVSHVHAFDADHAWALQGVSDREIARWNGEEWEVYETGVGTSGLWATGPDDVWVLSDATENAVLRGDGATLEPMAGSPGQPEAIWASGPDDVWVATDDAVTRWDGSEWMEVDTGLEAGAHLSGSASDNVWAFTGSGDARRFDGTDWHAHPLPETSCEGARSCYGPFFVRGPDDVWGAERSPPRLHHWNGSEWQPLELPTTLPIRALWGEDDTLWMLTTRDGILVLRDGS